MDRYTVCKQAFSNGTFPIRLGLYGMMTHYRHIFITHEAHHVWGKKEVKRRIGYPVLVKPRS